MHAPLLYSTGEPIRLGDTMTWGSEATGLVVVMIENGTAMPGYTAADWSYLEHGFMLFVEGAGLIHYDECEAGAELIRRA
jgi:hypothetical protein